MTDEWKLFPTDDINNIAKAINSKGVSGKFTVGEMADAVMEIEGGGGGIEPTTTLLLSSNKTKTTGSVTLTAELSTYRNYVSDSVEENGFVEGATVEFYNSDDELLYSNITKFGYDIMKFVYNINNMEVCV